jgi:hypothetical protein
MVWLGLWLYVVVGELVALVALGDDEGIAQVRWLFGRARWWMPYVGAALFVVAWPMAAVALLLMPRKPT